MKIREPAPAKAGDKTRAFVIAVIMGVFLNFMFSGNPGHEWMALGSAIWFFFAELRGARKKRVGRQ
jgi:hypothetical protein